MHERPFVHAFPNLVSLTQDPVRPISSHLSDFGWNTKVLIMNQEDLSTRREELLQLLPNYLPMDFGVRDRPFGSGIPKGSFRLGALIEGLGKVDSGAFLLRSTAGLGKVDSGALLKY